MISYAFRIAALLVVLALWPRALIAQEGSEGQRLYQAFVYNRTEPTELFIRKLTPSQRKEVIDHVHYLQTQETYGKKLRRPHLIF